MNIQKAFSFVYVAILLTITSSLQAQKLPNVQEASVYAPATIKIDAKINDWGNLQAFNKANGLSYTIANDDKTLYFVVKTDDPNIANKIAAGGIDLTINTVGKKTNKDAYIITFPMVDATKLRSQMSQFSNMRRGGTSGEQMDSAAIAKMRKQAVTNFKEIKLTGFKNIADSVISMYNDLGIKAAVTYDDNGALISELAMPLKYMGLTGSAVELTYNIKLNGLNVNAMLTGSGINAQALAAAAAAASGGGGALAGGGGFIAIRGMGDIQGMISPTDFWGKYTMAKK
jgi:hypothetical protein